MKRIYIGLVMLVAALTMTPELIQAQPGGYGSRGGYGPGPGMRGHAGSYDSPYDYGMGPGMMGGWGWVDIPSKLPAPKKVEWTRKLRDVLTIEKESMAQYRMDQEKYDAYMPYMMVIPQEEDHINWIGQLFAAYGLPADAKPAPAVQTKSLDEAYKRAVNLETDLLSRYEWLVKNAEDDDSGDALNIILHQTVRHRAMFRRAMGAGDGSGFRGPWMMGPGYGYGFAFPHVMFGAVILIVLAGVILIIIYTKRSKRAGGSFRESHLDILKKRYARGEITKEKFDAMKKDLD